ncbi:MAG: ribosome silencing factor [Proteobacteria bacterium]|nr:ribosome silencing factor [Pseudomonadota bacterium]
MVRDKVRAKESKQPTNTAAAAANGAPAASEELLAAVLASLEDDKAVEPVTIELARKSSIADYMVVASGTSQRHIAAMAQHAQERLKKAGYVTRSEGLPRCDWVLIDAGDVIVHLFRPEVRDFYNLEKMWSADFQVDGGRADAAGGGSAA